MLFDTLFISTYLFKQRPQVGDPAPQRRAEDERMEGGRKRRKNGEKRNKEKRRVEEKVMGWGEDRSKEKK